MFKIAVFLIGLVVAISTGGALLTGAGSIEERIAFGIICWSALSVPFGLVLGQVLIIGRGPHGDAN